VNPGLLHRTGRSDRQRRRVPKTWGPADRSSRRTARTASAESEVRPGPRIPTLRPYPVKTGEAGPEALSTVSLPNICDCRGHGRCFGVSCHASSSVLSRRPGRPGRTGDGVSRLASAGGPWRAARLGGGPGGRHLQRTRSRMARSTFAAAEPVTQLPGRARRGASRGSSSGCLRGPAGSCSSGRYGCGSAGVVRAAHRRWQRGRRLR